jgi:hypothetical protein
MANSIAMVIISKKWHPHDTSTAPYTSVDDPNGLGVTLVNGVNDKGLAGFIMPTSTTASGFVATPQK